MSSIIAQTVTPDALSITVAGGNTFTITRAELRDRILAESPPGRLLKARIKLKIAMRLALGPNFDPDSMSLRATEVTGAFERVSHFADPADATADEAT